MAGDTENNYLFMLMLLW